MNEPTPTGPGHDPHPGADVGSRSRVVLRPIATSLPLGYLAFGLGMIILAGDSLGWLDDEQVLVGVLLASYVFPLQLVATVMAFLGRDTASATTLGLFTTSWLSFGLIDILGDPGSPSTVLGVFSLAFGIVVAGLALVASRAKPVFGAVLTLCSARAVVDGLHILVDSSDLAFAAGCIGVATSLAAVYLGFALLIENVWPRAVLPLWRRGDARRALDGTLTASPRGITAEPGVREQL